MRNLLNKLKALSLGLLAVALVASAGPVSLVAGGSKGGIAAPNTPAPPSNVSPPTVPIAIAPLVEEDQVTFRYWPSVSPTDGTNAGAGIVSYDFNLDGTDHLLNTSIATNVQGDFTLAEIGSISVDPILTRVDSTDFTLTSGGGGTEANGGYNNASADRMAFAYKTWTPGNVVSMDIDTFEVAGTGAYPADYDAVLLAVRTGILTNSAMVSVDQRVIAGNKMLFVIWRTTNGVNRAAPIYATGNSSFGHLHIEDAGSCSWRVWSQADGGPLVLQQTVTGVCITSGVWGFGVNSLTADIATAKAKQLAARSATPITYVIAGTDPHTGKLRARDFNGNVSGWSVEQVAAGSEGPPPVTDLTKWRPGIYAQINAIWPLQSDTSLWTTLISTCNTLLAQSNVAGVQVIFYWGGLEGNTQGDYSPADSAIDRIITQCAQPHDKPVSFHIWPRRFNGAALPSTPQSSASRTFPDYVISNGWATVSFFQSAKLWQANVTDAYTGLWLHLISRYDSNRWVERFESEETSDDSSMSGYTAAARDTQWGRWIDAVGGAAKHTIIGWTVNWYEPFGSPGVELLKPRMAQAYALGMSFSGPDMYREAKTTFGECIIRALGATSGWSADGINCGNVDYRGKVALAYHQEYRNSEARNLQYDYSKNFIKNSHLNWLVISTGYNGLPATEDWSASGGVYDYLTSQPSPRTAVTCPENRHGTCTADFGSQLWEPTHYFDIAIDAANESQLRVAA